MSRYSRGKAAKVALELCGPTCPAVDAAFDRMEEGLVALMGGLDKEHSIKDLVDEACDAVKDRGTLLLRAALERACEQMTEIEEERDELLRKVADLEEQVSGLARELKELEERA